MHHIPYLLNIAILTPVVLGMLRQPVGAPVAAFDGIADAPSLRMMVACLWSGVLLVSMIALYDPLRFWPVLAFQVIYKSLYLVLWALPVWRGEVQGVLPRGPVFVFVGIVAIWPFLIVAAAGSGQM